MVEFNFGHFFSSIILPPFCWAKNRISENAVLVKWIISFWLREHFAWWNEQKWEDSIFQFTNVSSSNINTINLKIFPGSPTRFWECQGQKRFGCLGEWHKNNFPGEHLWQSAISGEVGVVGIYTPAPPPRFPGSLSLSSLFSATMVGGTYIYRFEKNLEKYSEEINLSVVHRNIIIKRGVNDEEVIEETFAGKFKRWRHNKKMNGFIIYTEKWPYLQSSSLYLIQRESQGYRLYDTV